MTKITELEESQEFSAAGSSKKALGQNFRKILKHADPARLAQRAAGSKFSGGIEAKQSQIVASEMENSIFKRNEERTSTAIPERQI
mmetsp:Transcript_33585/g.51673  ORF Transcript_33585/g.51673 Transcript_33585/m.51673 type:complete len:86 (+) Transcript_33585:1844-2101(+)